MYTRRDDGGLRLRDEWRSRFLVDRPRGRRRLPGERKIRRNAMTANADRILKDAVSKGDVPGVTAAATNAKGTTYEAGFGKRVLGDSADMTPDTVVWIASVTTAVTGAAAMQQVE